MQKTLYLHIGTEKTGSTALQAVSGVNRKILAKNGILFPLTPGERNQIRLTLFAADGPKTRNLRRLAGLAPNEAYARFKANFADEICSEVQKSSCARIFLSNEHLSSRLFSAKEVDRVAAVVRPLAEVAKVVVYLRPQPELYLSSYSTAIKAGRLRPLEPPAGIHDPRYNYERMLSLWANVFGEKNMVVRIYDRKSLVEGDVVKDFFSIMGYEPGADIKFPEIVNARLDYAALQFLREFNKHVPSFVKQGLNPERGDVASALAKKISTKALGVPAAELKKIAEIYEQSNARIAERFFKRSDGILFDNLEYLDSPDGEDLTVQRAIEIAAHLWRWKQRQYSKSRRELASLKENVDGAKKPS